METFSCKDKIQEFLEARNNYYETLLREYSKTESEAETAVDQFRAGNQNAKKNIKAECRGKCSSFLATFFGRGCLKNCVLEKRMQGENYILDADRYSSYK